MPKISAVINTRNEEHNIRYCLESVKWCDEIVVVDMESEDGTVGIAREFTDRIYTHEKVLAFDVAREFAVGKATGEWILLVDADELVSGTLSERLREIAGNDEADAVLIPFKNYLLGEWNKFTGWWPDYHCRFFKRSEMEFSSHIHSYQHLKGSARKISLPPEEAFAIHHFAYRDIGQFMEKLNRYTAIEASHLSDEKRAFSYFKLLKAGFGEFFSRYFCLRGYRDGARGLFVSIMMGMYRMVVYMKLWELYSQGEENAADRYSRLKTELLGKQGMGKPGP